MYYWQNVEYYFWGVRGSNVKGSMKLSSMDCTSVTEADEQDAIKIRENLPTDRQTTPMTTTTYASGPSLHDLLNQESDIHFLKDLNRLALLPADRQSPISGVAEVNGVYVLSIRGCSYGDVDQLTYTACKNCFKKLEESGACIKFTVLSNPQRLVYLRKK